MKYCILIVLVVILFSSCRSSRPQTPYRFVHETSHSFWHGQHHGMHAHYKSQRYAFWSKHRRGSKERTYSNRITY